jgi:hypothetical protein
MLSEGSAACNRATILREARAVATGARTAHCRAACDRILEPDALEGIAAAAHLAERPQPQANGSGRTEVGPLLAVYLPYWGRSSVNDDRERR